MGREQLLDDMALFRVATFLLFSSLHAVVAGEKALVANLGQNPRSRAVVSSYMPTLLTSGMMWLLLRPDEEDPNRWKRERYLLAKARDLTD